MISAIGPSLERRVVHLEALSNPRTPKPNPESLKTSPKICQDRLRRLPGDLRGAFLGTVPASLASLQSSNSLEEAFVFPGGAQVADVWEFELGSGTDQGTGADV